MISELIQSFHSLEELGFRLVGKEEFEDGVQTAVFEAPNGKVFLAPAIWGLPEEPPRIAARHLPSVVDAAKAFLKTEGLS